MTIPHAIAFWGSALLIVLIVWGWRAPQLPWFTGRVALAMVVMLAIFLVLAVLLTEWNRGDLRLPSRGAVPQRTGPVPVDHGG